jgi:hypothetical protein
VQEFAHGGRKNGVRFFQAETKSGIKADISPNPSASSFEVIADGPDAWISRIFRSSAHGQ